MNWSAISAVADLATAVAVILSLVYVAIQVRQGTRATRASTLQALTTDLGLALHAQATNGELAAVMKRGMASLEDLDDLERFRFLSQLGHVFRLYESLHAHYASGTLDPDIWRGYERAIRGLASYPGVRTVWELRRDVYSAPFRAFLDGDGGEPAPKVFGTLEDPG